MSTGKVYSEQEVFLQYYDAAGMEYHSDNFGATLTLTVTAWPGIGGYATGTYSAILKTGAIVPNDAVITNGILQGFIINFPQVGVNRFIAVHRGQRAITIKRVAKNESS